MTVSLSAVAPNEGDGLGKTLQRRIDLYTAWGKPDQTAKWQAELDGGPETNE